MLPDFLKKRVTLLLGKLWVFKYIFNSRIKVTPRMYWSKDR